MGPGHGGSRGTPGKEKLEKIATGLIQSKMVKYLGKLLVDAKPRS
ncbi:MAG TPA: hypothetical protein VKI44_39655 [Acetobacteraceae bacterium]|nr:hypothetical protein [Acetobacteraceae bacterium]